MTAPARYMFDTVFPGRATEHNNHAEVPKFTDEDIRLTREAAFQEGLNKGLKESADQVSLMLNQKIEKLLTLTRKIEQQLPQEIEKITELACDLAFVSARTLASELIACEPQAELDVLFSECIAQMSNAPHLAVKVPPTDLELLRDRLEQVAESKGYEGKLILLADDEMREGDCHIEWADGGISRSRDDLETRISTLIANRFHDPEAPELIEEKTNENVAPEPEQPVPEGN